MKVSPNSFQLEFLYEDYGSFIDAGVDGKETKYGTRKYGLETFSYKNKMPPPNALLKWANKKRLRLRDKETGKFMLGGQQSLAFIIARSIFKHGIKPSYFFTNAFEKAYKKLPQDIIEAYGLDGESFLDYTINK